MKREEIQKGIYFTGLALLVISLPFSLFLLSLSLFILLVNWLIDKNLPAKIKLILSRKSILVLISIYAVHLLGLLFTTNFEYAFHDLKIKLPLLVLPVIIGTTEQPDKKKIKWLLLLFSGAVLVSTFIVFFVYLFQDQLQITDQRDISIFISHIRFSLLVDLSVFILLYMAFFPYFNVPAKNRIFYVMAAAWLSFFLLILESFTGIIIFLIIFPVFILNWSFHQNKRYIRYIAFFIVAGILSATVVYFYHSYRRFYSVEKTDLTGLEQKTEGKRNYFHDVHSSYIENGNYVWIYICEEEMEKEWNSRSQFRYDGPDKKGQELKYTLIRYLTSKGLRKDSTGVASLTPADIRSIENGNSNYLFNRKLSIYPRIYQLIWEFDTYKKGGDASGHSLVQRIEYLKNAGQIIERNLLTGVGTGDVKDEFMKQYELSGSRLAMKWRLRAHNQYVTFLLTFGIIGFAWIMWAFFFPVFYERKNLHFLSVIFILIAFLSMLNEDTLETHTGITFFAFFYSFFILGYRKHDEKPTGN